MMRPALGLALLLIACRGGGVDRPRPDEAPRPPASDSTIATPTPIPTPPPKPPPVDVAESTWASWAGPCKTDDECTGVGRGCCPCGASSYHPVLKVHEDEANARTHAGEMDCRCPQQDCNMIRFHCRKGTCTVEEQ